MWWPWCVFIWPLLPGYLLLWLFTFLSAVIHCDWILNLSLTCVDRIFFSSVHGMRESCCPDSWPLSSCATTLEESTRESLFYEQNCGSMSCRRVNISSDDWYNARLLNSFISSKIVPALVGRGRRIQSLWSQAVMGPVASFSQSQKYCTDLQTPKELNNKKKRVTGSETNNFSWFS